MSDLYHGDCLDILPTLNEQFDLILVDLPYGTTACKWDSVIPFEKMWHEVNRLSKPKAAQVFTASQPFTSKLVCSNINNFRYEWVWQKTVGSNFAVLKYQPMKEHESVLVFSKESHNYYPIMQERKGSGAERVKNPYHQNSLFGGEATGGISRNNAGKEYGQLRNPSSVQLFNGRDGHHGLHPTQKPLAMMEYFIKTYTKEGESVLDFTMGSGTIGLACKNLGRRFVGIEKDEKYFNIAKSRMEQK